MSGGGLPSAFFTSPDVYQREVKLGDESVHPLHFREASSKVWRRYWVSLAQTRDNAEDESFDMACAQLIAASVCNPDGTPALDVEKALTLRFEVQQAIIRAMREPLGESPGKD